MRTLAALLVSSITTSKVMAASLVINWSISDERRLYDRNARPLDAGTSAPGDGTLLQLGYYDRATTANPFLGSWIVLATTSMGDDGLETAGQFTASSILGAGSFPEPALGTPLAIRFYDGVTVESSSYYNAVSVTDGSWNFQNLSDPAPVLDLVIEKGPPTVFETGPLGDFMTRRAIPEPSTFLLAVTGAVAVGMRRKPSMNRRPPLSIRVTGP